MSGQPPHRMERHRIAFDRSMALAPAICPGDRQLDLLVTGGDAHLVGQAADGGGRDAGDTFGPFRGVGLHPLFEQLEGRYRCGAIGQLEVTQQGRIGPFGVVGDSLLGQAVPPVEVCRAQRIHNVAVGFAQHHAEIIAGRILVDELPRVGISGKEFPVVQPQPDQFMTVSDLTRAAIVVSDNTAANLLLSKLGGPSVVTEFARSCGDAITRLDRNEPTLNDNESGDLRDTTSPRAMATLMNKVLCGNRLSSTSRDLLLQWLRDCDTGHDRLRAKLPKDWLVGDKTGTGGHGAVNDVAIAIPPGRSPILIAAFLSEGKADRSALVAAHASISRLVADHFA